MLADALAVRNNNPWCSLTNQHWTSDAPLPARCACVSRSHNRRRSIMMEPQELTHDVADDVLAAVRRGRLQRNSVRNLVVAHEIGPALELAITLAEGPSEILTAVPWSPGPRMATFAEALTQGRRPIPGSPTDCPRQVGPDRGDGWTGKNAGADRRGPPDRRGLRLSSAAGRSRRRHIGRVGIEGQRLSRFNAQT